MAYYTTNLCQNPSFQNGLAGYSPLLSSAISLSSASVLFGAKNSLLVQTPGSAAGEGVITASALITNGGNCSASLYVQGEGTLNISANINPGGTVAATIPVMLTSNWQRVVINDIPVGTGQILYLTAYTNTVQAATFWLSAVQIEPSTPGHPYCDGDQPGCQWLSGPPGISVQPYQFFATGAAFSVSAGNLVHALDISKIFSSFPPGGVSKSTGQYKVHASVVNPAGAFDDFAIFQSGDLDPAQTYPGVNNASSSSSTGTSYTRVFSTFYPPLDYPVSGGTLLWPRAAFASVGFQFINVGGSGTQNITDVQTELLPVTQTTPSNYQLPRQVNTIVKPNRLNFITNPGFETSTAQWSALGTASLAQDNTVFLPIVTVIDDVQTSSLNSMKITLNAPGDGATISVSNLIVGHQYIASAYVQAGIDIADIVLACGGGSGTVTSGSSSGSGYGSGTYGGGTYGGVLAAGGPDLQTGVWFRPSFTFTATQSTHAFNVNFIATTDISYPATIWVDSVILEAGSDLQGYFDGNFGKNYFWEGTTNLSRSYFYDQFALKGQAVINVLNKHIPLGISYGTPQYKIPYTQS